MGPRDWFAALGAKQHAVFGRASTPKPPPEKKKERWWKLRRKNNRSTDSRVKESGWREPNQDRNQQHDWAKARLETVRQNRLDKKKQKADAEYRKGVDKLRAAMQEESRQPNDAHPPHPEDEKQSCSFWRRKRWKGHQKSKAQARNPKEHQKKFRFRRKEGRAQHSTDRCTFWKRKKKPLKRNGGTAADPFQDSQETFAVFPESAFHEEDYRHEGRGARVDDFEVPKKSSTQSTDWYDESECPPFPEAQEVAQVNMNRFSSSSHESSPRQQFVLTQPHAPVTPVTAAEKKPKGEHHGRSRKGKVKKVCTFPEDEEAPDIPTTSSPSVATELSRQTPSVVPSQQGSDAMPTFPLDVAARNRQFEAEIDEPVHNPFKHSTSYKSRKWKIKKPDTVDLYSSLIYNDHIRPPS